MGCKSSARSLLRALSHRNSSWALVAFLGLAIALLSSGSHTLQVNPLNVVGTLGPGAEGLSCQAILVLATRPHRP
jgi:hypothetical protein